MFLRGLHALTYYSFIDFLSAKHLFLFAPAFPVTRLIGSRCGIVASFVCKGDFDGLHERLRSARLASLARGKFGPTASDCVHEESVDPLRTSIGRAPRRH